jgi:hypothetical protein
MAKLFRPGDQCPVAGNLIVTLPFRCGLPPIQGFRSRKRISALS